MLRWEWSNENYFINGHFSPLKSLKTRWKHVGTIWSVWNMFEHVGNTSKTRWNSQNHHKYNEKMLKPPELLEAYWKYAEIILELFLAAVPTGCNVCQCLASQTSTFCQCYMLFTNRSKPNDAHERQVEQLSLLILLLHSSNKLTFLGMVIHLIVRILAS